MRVSHDELAIVLSKVDIETLFVLQTVSRDMCRLAWGELIALYNERLDRLLASLAHPIVLKSATRRVKWISCMARDDWRESYLDGAGAY